METVYYCWSCDAHRVAQVLSGQKVTCPCCHVELAEDSRLAAVVRRPGLVGTSVQIKHRLRSSANFLRPVAKGA